MGFFKKSDLQLKKTNLPPILKIKVPEHKEKEKTRMNFNPTHHQMLMDLECYPNYFLAKFHRIEDNNILSFERTEEKEFDKNFVKMILDKFEIITFNGNNYDIPMLKLALTGASNKKLKKGSDTLIAGGTPIWKFEEKYNLPELEIKHVDLIELCPGFVSLKIYGGRLNCKKMQDLPYEDTKELIEKEMQNVNDYCGNDLRLTKILTRELLPQIELRRTMSKKYKTDLMSKSDAQIAETVIGDAVKKITKKKLVRQDISKHSFLYKAPEFLKFNHPELQKAFKTVTTERFQIASNGKTVSKKIKLRIGSSVYTMGIGGLHSTEKTAFHVADEFHSIHDFDITSCYPRIILNCGLYPKQMTEVFLDVYENIVEERIAAKKSGDKVKAETFKILINGSFGKFGSPYSILYAPELMIQVTLTGQLSLLMLIEMMEAKGIPVISGNTDGVVIKCPKNKEEIMRRIVYRWEHITGYSMEETKYIGIYSANVNNYLAFQDDGSVKRKGWFRSPGLNKNPENEICSIAMIEYIKNGIPFKETIEKCKDITKFVTIKSVAGGAVKNGVYLGKAIRWYHSRKEQGTINYLTNGNKVPLTEGAKPLMELPKEFPNDVDYDYYVQACYNLFTKGK